MKTAGLVVLVGAMISVGVYGCKKEEPVRENAPTKSVEQKSPPPKNPVVEPPKETSRSVTLEYKLFTSR